MRFYIPCRCVHLIFFLLRERNYTVDERTFICMTKMNVIFFINLWFSISIGGVISGGKSSLRKLADEKFIFNIS